MPFGLPATVEAFDSLADTVERAVDREIVGLGERCFAAGASLRFGDWLISAEGLRSGQGRVARAVVTRAQHYKYRLRSNLVRALLVCRRVAGGEAVWRVELVWRFWNLRAFLELAGRFVPVEETPE